MSTEPTVSKGIRLPADVWQKVAAEAESLTMTPNEWVRRKILGALHRDGDVQKPSSKSQNTHETVELSDD